MALHKTVPEIASELNLGEEVVRNKLSRLKVKPVKKKKASVNPLEEHKQKTIERYDKQFVNQLLKERTDRDIVTDILKEIVPKIDFTPKPLPERKPKNNKEIVVLNLNDVHIGRYPRELLQKKADYLVSSALEIVEIQRGKATIDELVINMVGDIVDGDGIFPNQPYEQKFHLMDQMFSVGLPVISGMINELSNHFKKEL